MAEQNADQDLKLLADRLSDLPPEFSHFASVYEKDLRPFLQEKETERLAAVGYFKKFALIGFGVAAALGGAGFFLAKSPIFGIAGLIVGAATGGWGYNKLASLSSHIKEMLIQPVADQFGLQYDKTAGQKAEEHISRYRSLDLLPGHDRKSMSDELIGERNGRTFEFFEAHLEEKRTTTDSKGRSQTTWVTVFRGQCWVMDAPKRFHGTTKVARDSGWFNGLGAMGSKWSQAKLEDPVFEKIFEVYTTDQVEARYLLTPDMMQKIVDLETELKGQKIRFAYDENKIFIAAEGGNLFEPSSMFKSLNDPERVGKLLKDFAHVFHVMDILGACKATELP